MLEHQGTQIHFVNLHACDNCICLWTLSTAANGEEVCILRNSVSLLKPSFTTEALVTRKCTDASQTCTLAEFSQVGHVCLCARASLPACVLALVLYGRDVWSRHVQICREESRDRGLLATFLLNTTISSCGFHMTYPYVTSSPLSSSTQGPFGDMLIMCLLINSPDLFICDRHPALLPHAGAFWRRSHHAPRIRPGRGGPGWVSGQ